MSNQPNCSRVQSVGARERAPAKAVRERSILLDAPEGVATGQAAVFYDPDSRRVLGGGWISGAS